VYYVNGANQTWEEIVAAIGNAVGRRPVVVPLPAVAVRTAGYVARAWSRLTGVKPLLTPERAWDLRQPSWTCNDARARKELGYQPTVTLDEGMRETATWYKAQGWM